MTSSLLFLWRRGREGRREVRRGGREPTAVHVPCARSHSNASKLPTVLVDRFFPQCLVARREEREEKEEEKKEKGGGGKKERARKRKKRIERKKERKDTHTTATPHHTTTNTTQHTNTTHAVHPSTHFRRFPHGWLGAHSDLRLHL